MKDNDKNYYLSPGELGKLDEVKPILRKIIYDKIKALSIAILKTDPKDTLKREEIYTDINAILQIWGEIVGFNKDDIINKLQEEEDIFI